MAKKKTSPKSKHIARPAERTNAVPATLGMLHDVRDELKSDIRALDHKMNSRFDGLNARFGEIDARFNKIDARFSEMDARFNKIDARFDVMSSRLEEMHSSLEKMSSRMHQMHLLAEEQNARNKIVMDGLTSLFVRQERGEERIDSMEKLLARLK
jgi:chromosome segregation ATPase